MRNMRTNEPLQQYIMMLYLRVTAARRNRNTVMVFFILGFLIILGDYFFADPNLERRFILFLVELLLGLSLVYSSVYLRIIESFQELTEVLERQGITPERKRLPDQPAKIAITRPRDRAGE